MRVKEVVVVKIVDVISLSPVCEIVLSFKNLRTDKLTMLVAGKPLYHSTKLLAEYTPCAS